MKHTDGQSGIQACGDCPAGRSMKQETHPLQGIVRMSWRDQVHRQGMENKAMDKEFKMSMVHFQKEVWHCSKCDSTVAQNHGQECSMDETKRVFWTTREGRGLHPEWKPAFPLGYVFVPDRTWWTCGNCGQELDANEKAAVNAVMDSIDWSMAVICDRWTCGLAFGNAEGIKCDRIVV